MDATQSTRNQSARDQQPPLRFGKEFWRTPTKIIAYIDISWAFLEILLMVAFLIFAAISGNQVELQEGEAKMTKQQVTIIIVLFIVLNVVFSLVKIWFGVQLLTATQLTTPIQEAGEKARLWRNLKFAFVCLDGLVLILTVGGSMRDSWSIVFFLYRIITLFIVHEFIRELDQQLPPTPAPRDDQQTT